MVEKLKPYRKTAVAVAAAVLTFAVMVLRSPAETVTSGEVEVLILLVAAAFGVYMVPNAQDPPQPPVN